MSIHRDEAKTKIPSELLDTYNPSDPRNRSSKNILHHLEHRSTTTNNFSRYQDDSLRSRKGRYKFDIKKVFFTARWGHYLYRSLEKFRRRSSWNKPVKVQDYNGWVVSTEANEEEQRKKKKKLKEEGW